METDLPIMLKDQKIVCIQHSTDGKGAVVLWQREHPIDPFVVHYWNKEDQALYMGEYCGFIHEATRIFGKRCKNL